MIRNDEPTPLAFGWRLLAMPGFVLLCWGLAVRHLSSEWSLSEQYHYGWIVPLLALYLLRVRLENTPPAVPVKWPWAVTGCILLVALAEVVLLPVQAANADWRLLGWALTALATMATLLLVGQVGGLPWMLHLAFPVLFFFTAVPLPHPLENEIMQWLMLHNARLAAEFLHWWGVEAEVQGNLIRLASATVGINEACSGIRSLQGTLMMALFVGEIFGLRRWRRLWLLLTGAGCALATNTARTLFLCLMTERGGIEAHDRWHDSAGLWGLVGCVVGVTVVGWLLSRNQRCSVATPRAPGWMLTGRLAALSCIAMVGVILIFTGWGATEAWFRVQEAAVTRVSGWRFKQPTEVRSFVSVEQTRGVRGELRYDFHSGGRWVDADERHWVAHYFRWDPGRNALGAIRVHDPRVCLGASGKQLVQILPIVSYLIGDRVIPFDAYWFQDRGQDVFVFNCVVEDVRRGPWQDEDHPFYINTSSRLEAALAGKRDQGQRRLEIAVWGASDAAIARTAFEGLLRRQVVLEEIQVRVD